MVVADAVGRGEWRVKGLVRWTVMKNVDIWNRGGELLGPPGKLQRSKQLLY